MESITNRKSQGKEKEGSKTDKEHPSEGLKFNIN
jgi:hypothetical protein